MSLDRKEDSLGITHPRPFPFTTSSWPGGSPTSRPPSLPAPGLGKEIIRGGFWER